MCELHSIGRPREAEGCSKAITQVVRFRGRKGLIVLKSPVWMLPSKVDALYGMHASDSRG
jgi:hypothetical protein